MKPDQVANLLGILGYWDASKTVTELKAENARLREAIADIKKWAGYEVSTMTYLILTTASHALDPMEDQPMPK